MTRSRKPASRTVGDLLRWAEARLPDDGGGSGRLEIDRILAHVLGVERSDLYLEPARQASEEEADRFLHLLSERLRGKPLQHLVGEVEFLSLPFRIAPGVFVPRPETETLVERVVAEAPRGESRWIDIGTGAGVIAVSLAVRLPEATIVATDVSSEALQLAGENAARNGVAARVRRVRSNGLAAFRRTGWATGIVSNPPYVADGDITRLPIDVRDHDPLPALRGGPDGLDRIREWTAAGPDILAPHGILALEIGETQAEAVLSLLRKTASWDRMAVHPDLTGRDRVVLARRAG